MKFKYKESDDIFFTSDSHFNHNNIIRYCNRPFNNIDEMNEILIQNWNSVVKEDSIVFHLGDFAFCGSHKANEILSRLNGRIILIKGNHDNFQDSILNKFEGVYQQLHIEIGNKSIYLNHYPFLTYSGIYRKNPVIQLFGHEHINKLYLNKDISRLNLLLPSQYDVGVDLNNYTPISWKEVSKKIDFQIKNNVNCFYWIGYRDSLIKKIIRKIKNWLWR